MANYQNIKLEKSMYQSGDGFVRQLQRMDPDSAYAGTELAGLSAFERQLKRFGIKVSGSESDRIEKFFKTSDSALLFPAYLSKAVEQGVSGFDILDQIVATKTKIDSMDYRSIASTPSEGEKELKEVLEGGHIPQTTVSLQDHLVRLVKRGRMLVSSYEAIRFQRLDLFSVTLKQIGAYIGKSQLKDAVNVLINGDGNDNAAGAVACKTAGTLAYEDLTNLWASFTDYEMNVLLAAPDMAGKLLSLTELRNTGDGQHFLTPASYATPFGATLIKTDAVPAGTIVALDKNCALEMVSAGDINVDYDKLIDCQLERVAITSITGFAKIFPDAVKVLKLK